MKCIKGMLVVVFNVVVVVVVVVVVKIIINIPVKSFSWRSKLINFVRLPISVGILPTN